MYESPAYNRISLIGKPEVFNKLLGKYPKALKYSTILSYKTKLNSNLCIELLLNK